MKLAREGYQSRQRTLDAIKARDWRRDYGMASSPFVPPPDWMLEVASGDPWAWARIDTQAAESEKGYPQ